MTTIPSYNHFPKYEFKERGHKVILSRMPVRRILKFDKDNITARAAITEAKKNPKLNWIGTKLINKYFIFYILYTWL